MRKSRRYPAARIIADLIRAAVRDHTILVPHQLEGGDFLVEWNGRAWWVSVREIEDR
jgi:hypothetical protein